MNGNGSVFTETRPLDDVEQGQLDEVTDALTGLGVEVLRHLIDCAESRIEDLEE